eukprot:7058669-Prymnesium_polylepis.1
MHLCCHALCNVRAAMSRAHSSLKTPVCCCLTMNSSMYARRARTLGSVNVNSKASSSFLKSSYSQSHPLRKPGIKNSKLGIFQGELRNQ